MLPNVKESRAALMRKANCIINNAWNDNKRALTKDEDRQFNELMDQADALDKSPGRNGSSWPGGVAAAPTMGFRNAEERRSLINTWGRAGVVNLTEPEIRALTTTIGTAGGDTIAPGFQYQLEIATKYYGGIVSAADYIDTDTGTAWPYPTFDDTANTGEITAENTAPTGSLATGAASEVDPTYGAVSFGAYTIDSGFITASIQLLQDSAFDLDGYLLDALGTRVMRKTNTLATTGTGNNQPTGVINAINVGATSVAGTGLTYVDIVNLIYSVDASYRMGPKVGFMCHDSTLAVLEKIVDNNGRPLWLAGGTTGDPLGQMRPSTLKGYPVWINNDMPTVAAGNKALIFGDFSKFKIRRVKDSFSIRRLNERFIDKLAVGFIAYQRVDSNCVNPKALKVLQQAAS